MQKNGSKEARNHGQTSTFKFIQGVRVAAAFFLASPLNWCFENNGWIIFIVKQDNYFFHSLQNTLVPQKTCVLTLEMAHLASFHMRM